MLAYVNSHKQISPPKFHFISLGNKEVYWFLRCTAQSVFYFPECHLVHNFIFFFSNNTFFMNHEAKFKYLPWMDEAYCGRQECQHTVLSERVDSLWNQWLLKCCHDGHRNCQNKVVFMKLSRECQNATMFVIVCAVWHPSTRTLLSLYQILLAAKIVNPFEFLI